MLRAPPRPLPLVHLHSNSNYQQSRNGNIQHTGNVVGAVAKAKQPARLLNTISVGSRASASGLLQVGKIYRPSVRVRTMTRNGRNDHQHILQLRTRDYATSSTDSNTTSTTDTQTTTSSDLTSTVKRSGEKFWHYTKLAWNAIKQLYRNSKQAHAIRRRIRKGEQVSRRELRFVELNSKDLVRAVPFLLAWKIPLLGKAVTILAVWKAPCLLPSTFNFLKPEETWRMKLEKAKLYQKYIKSRLKDHKLPEQVRTDLPTYPITAESARRLVERFGTHLNVWFLNNDQLSALCNALDLNGWGLSFQLRDRIWKHLGKISIDDALIKKEGVDSLTPDELEEACKERGLYLQESFTPDDLRNQIKEWLNFAGEHPEQRLPLLVYHHAYIHGTVNPPLWLQPATQSTSTH